MNVHLDVVLGKSGKEVNHLGDIAECLDACLDEECDSLAVKAGSERLLNVGNGKREVFVLVHGFEVLAVHPAELDIVKHSG